MEKNKSDYELTQTTWIALKFTSDKANLFPWAHLPLIFIYVSIGLPQFLAAKFLEFWDYPLGIQISLETVWFFIFYRLYF